MSRWTHAICDHCFARRHPDRGGAHGRLVTPDPDMCCYCNTATMSGLYDRNDPAETPCGGIRGRVHHR